MSRNTEFGRPLSLSQWRPEGARAGADDRRATADRRACDARHRVLARRRRACSSRSARTPTSRRAAAGSADLARRQWEAEHGAGAAWGSETDRAAVLVFDPQGGDRRVFASGVRNCVGMAIAACDRRSVVLDQRTRRARRRSAAGLCHAHSRRARSTAGPGTISAPMRTHGTAARAPTSPTRSPFRTCCIQPHSAPLGMTFYDRRRSSPPSIAARPSPPCTARGTGRSAPATRSSASSCATACRPANTRTSSPASSSTTRGSGAGRWASPSPRTVRLLFTEDGNGTIWRVSYVGAGAAQ